MIRSLSDKIRYCVQRYTHCITDSNSVDKCKKSGSSGCSPGNVVTLLLPKDAWLTDGVWCCVGFDDHSLDCVVSMHMLQISKVEVRTTTVPESEIQGTGAGVLCSFLTGNNDMAIKISDIVCSDSGSKVQ